MILLLFNTFFVIVNKFDHDESERIKGVYNMDIQHLKYFVEVAKQRNFTKASRILLVSQPSISKMVKSLEDELKVTLLDRSERQD